MLSVAPCSHCSSRSHVQCLGLLSAAMPRQVEKQCSRHCCWNGAASLRARICTVCFKRNAAAVGKRGGRLPKIRVGPLVGVKKWKKKSCMYGLQKKCSRHGCRNDIQGAGWARFCPACIHKAQSASAKRSTLLRAMKKGEKGKKKCSRHGRRNDAASLRARFARPVSRRTRRLWEA